MDQHSKQDLDLLGRPPAKHADWSHRRGEPRVFALLWMGYLMALTALMFASMSGAYTVSRSITRPAAQGMLIAAAIGITVVWPMVRLSQSAPSGQSVRWSLRDFVVIMIPVQAVVLPQLFPVLAGWSVSVVLAVDAFFCVWALVIAGLISMAYRSIGSGSRHAGIAGGVWMVIILAVVLAAPAVGLVSAAGTDAGVQIPRVGWLLSPVSGMLELTRDRSVLGTGAKVEGSHWRMIAAIGCVGSALLLFGYTLEVARGRGRG